jgi:hypothetical protein
MTMTGTRALPETVTGKPWTIHSNGRLHNGLIVGSAAAGKTLALGDVALAAAGLGCDVRAIFPQSASIGEIRTVLASALEEVNQRVEAASEQRLTGWKPTSGVRGLVISVDQCPSVFRDAECQRLAYEVARRGNKVGVAIVAAGQDPTLRAFGGGSDAQGLRDVLTSAGNVALLDGRGDVAR